MTFDLLAPAIRKLRKDIPERVAEATNEVAIVFLESVIRFTPVDTTKALSNWQVSLNEATEGVIGARVPGVAGSTKAASAAEAVAAGRRELRNRRVGIEIHISNNAPYIDLLNDGSISEQPGNFVAKARVLTEIQIRNTKIKLD